MPETFLRIRGGRHLRGAIDIRGSKNTVLPCIAAALLTQEKVILNNVPGISDVGVMLKIAQKLGAHVEWDKVAHRLTIEARDLLSSELDEELPRKLRGSFLFSGALIGRMKKASLPYPGGDKIGARPLTTHLNAMRQLGVTFQENGRLELDGAGLCGNRVLLEEVSLTATENTILAAVLAPGESEIHMADQSSHVQELVRLLCAMGAKVAWGDVGVLKIEGVKKLKGANFIINPEEVEISGFAALAAATNSAITICGIERRYLDAVFLQLSKIGVQYQIKGQNLLIEKSHAPYKGFRLQSGLYPKLMPDHLPPFAVLATQAAGESLIHEWMYDGRLGYIEELRKMGANATVLDPHRAIIVGPTPLHGTTIASLDIRSGMTVLIAALVADGETVISGAEHLDRGYEKIEERLASLGAQIERFEA